MRRAAPGLAVLTVAVALWLAFGVGPGDVGLFLAYELLFLLAPGWFLYIALSERRHGLLREVSIGWALGHVLEIGAFALTASLGIRHWLFLYPVLVIGGSAGVIRRRTSGGSNRAPLRRPDSGLSTRWLWATGALASLLLLYVAALYFAHTPLPGRSGFGGWVPDTTFELDLAGQLLHHWPLTTPEVSGTSLPYESFVHMHLAAIAQVTGISLPVVLLRLYVVPLLALLCVQLCWAGRRLTGEMWSGPLALSLVLLVGEVNPDLKNLVGSTFHPLLSMLFSPTYLLGLTLFVPCVVLLAESCGAIPRATKARETWIVLGLLLVGASGAKGAVLPVLAGGLVLQLAWRLLCTKRLDVATAAGLLLTIAVGAGSYWVLYSGVSEGLHVESRGTAVGIPRLASLASPFEHVAVLSTLFWLWANLLAVLMFAMAPLAGLIWLRRLDGRLTHGPTALLLGMFLSGLIPFFWFFAPGFSQVWFTEYGFVPAALLSAWGFCVGWRRWGRAAAISRSLAAVLGTAALAAVLITYAAWRWGFGGFASYAMWVVLFVALGAALLVRLTRASEWIAVVALLPIAAFAVVDLPFRAVAEMFDLGPKPAYTNTWGSVQPGLLSSLAWIRTHTSPNAVLAVNNYWLSAFGARQPYFMYYSALSQRQVYLEGWTETLQVLGSHVIGTLVKRRRLNDAVFQRADRGALAEMLSSAGVRYLLVDEVNGHATPAVSRIATLVHADEGVDVYAVR